MFNFKLGASEKENKTKRETGFFFCADGALPDYTKRSD